MNAGGTLGGNGRLPTTTINGGTLSPGNSIGTITIGGNLSSSAPATTSSRSRPPRPTAPMSTGTAALAGTLSAVGTGGNYTVGTKYTVFNATGGVSGTFGNLCDRRQFRRRPSRTSNTTPTTSIWCSTRAIAPLAGLAANQRAVATAIDTALAGGNQAAPFLALFNLSAAQLPGALDQLSGEVHATAGVLLDESLLYASRVLGRLRQASYGGDARWRPLAGRAAAFAGGEELTRACLCEVADRHQGAAGSRAEL